MTSPARLLGLAIGAILFVTAVCPAAIPSPREHFGFAIGDDHQLANYTETEEYFHQLAATSDRVQLVDIGRTSEGRTQWMLVVTAPENRAALARFQEISRLMARADGVSESEARALAAEGKAVVWIDGGLHADETVATHQLIETAWLLASADDPEIQRVLRDTIVLLVHANPDGQELVSNWYRREPTLSRRKLIPPPRLYHRYIGHDNNRDFYLSAMAETTNLNRQLYLEWFPQIVFNHHQPAPAGTVLFVPPFRDPFNYNLDPLVILGVEAAGNALQTRFLLEDKPGVTTRTGANYSTWFNGSLRTTAYFHNMIGLLAETAGGPTPTEIALVPRRQLPSNDLPAPIAPQPWRFRQSIDYAVTANRAVLDYAARHREALLYNIYRMGRNSIERGQRDHWTPWPSRIEEVARLAAGENAVTANGRTPAAAAQSAELATATRPIPTSFHRLLERPEWRDPRGFIIPADQPDFPTAVKFINALVKTGVAVQRATREFVVAGRTYPAGSYVVRTDQAFRPHVMDMFEPQDHPNDFKTPGGPPTRPYDVAGWTLALQMGVKFDRVLDAFEGPFEQLPYGQLQTPPQHRPFDAEAPGYLVSPTANDTAILINRLLAQGVDVWRVDDEQDGVGAIYIPNQGAARAVVTKTAPAFGLTVRGINRRPTGAAWRQGTPRIALWDRYGGSIASGWMRWILEQFEFPFEVIYTPQIDAGNLRARYDAVILVSGAVSFSEAAADIPAVPAEVRRDFGHQLGLLTAQRSLPALKEFMDAGGTVVALGASAQIAFQLGLPVENALATTGADGRAQPLTEASFFVPGSILEARVDVTDPLAWGMPGRVNVTFNRDTAFKLSADATAAGIKPVVWFDDDAPLRSGWAWGQSHLRDGVIVATAPVGRGRLHLMSVDVVFRAQTHGTFKLLLNALHQANAELESSGAR